MNRKLNGLRRLGLALIVGAALAGCASEPIVASAEMAQKIEAARTPADHEAIASHYTKEAAVAKSIAESHRKMARAYQGQIYQRGGAGMAAHCHSIVRAQETAAGEYEALAAMHRDMARQAKP